MTPNTIVRALDVGYGNTKYSTVDTTGKTCYRAFRSLAPTAVTTDISAGTMRKRDTVHVTIDDVCYEVGPDAEFVTDVQHVHVSDHSYVAKPEYRALCRGALAYMKAPRIDALVVGLPVTRVALQAAKLRAELIGLHRLDNGTSIEVKKVIVIAQPIGGALHTAFSSGDYGNFCQQTTLTIDIGAGTSDALVSRGLRAFPKRCETHSGGMGAVLRQLASAATKVHRAECSTLMLDKALRSGTLAIAGQKLPLTSILPQAWPVIDMAIDALLATVGTVDDIDRVVLIGGGAPFFEPRVRHRFPNHEVSVCDAGIFANVRGFQIAGTAS